MGAVTFSLDPTLINVIKSVLPCRVFVETGTFRGDTIEVVKDSFSAIYSIELSQVYYNASVERFKDCSHVTLLHGDAASALASIMPNLQQQSTLFWLDAHWCVAQNTAGQSSQCPLIEELEAIQHLNQDSLIIIDDARLFLAAPPHPHEISDWPSFDSILKKLHDLSRVHDVAVVNDCILFYPHSLRAGIQQFAHEHGVDWLHVMDKSRDYDKILAQLTQKDKLLRRLIKKCNSIKCVFQYLRQLVKRINKTIFL
jgi:hypothetical protein